MQVLQRTPQTSPAECYAARWGCVSSLQQPVQKRLWTFSKGSNVIAFDLDGESAVAVDARLSLSSEDNICMLAPCPRCMQQEAPAVAIGTQTGAVVLLELATDQVRAGLKTERWTIAARASLAHAAPVDFGAWAHDASCLATAAADGSVIIWKRQGLSCVASFTLSAKAASLLEENEKFGGGISCLCWDAQADLLLIAWGESLSVARMLWGPSHPDEATSESTGELERKRMPKVCCCWLAHLGGVTSADWARRDTCSIASVGLDHRCCIWTTQGVLVGCMQTEQLIASPYPWPVGANGSERTQLDCRGAPEPTHPTAVAWSQEGDLLLIAASQNLAVCTPQGHVLDLHHMAEDFISELHWFPEGREIAAACGFSGFYTFELFAKKRLSWRFCTLLLDRTSLELQDMFEGRQRQVSPKDPIVDFAQSPECVALITKKQCIIILTQDFTANNTAPLCSLETPQQPQQIFVGLSSVCYTDASCLHVVNLLGTRLCTIPRPVDAGNKIKTACSAEFVALLRGRWMQRLQLYNGRNGKVLGDYTHSCEIKKVEVNQTSNGGKTFVAILDVTGTLLVADAVRPTIWQEVSGLVTCMRWVWEKAALTAIVNGELMMWLISETNVSCSKTLYHPQVLNSNLTKGACEIIAAEKEGLQILYANGTTKRHLLSPLPLQLLEELKKQNWKTSASLCAMEDHESLWSAFARAALSNQSFAAAAVALAALKDLPRLQLALKGIDASCPQKQHTLSILICGTLKNIREAAAALRRNGQADKAAKLCMENNLWEDAVSLSEGRSSPHDKVLEKRNRLMQLLRG